MDGDQRAVLEDADLVRERMDFDHPAAGRVGNTVGIAADADHAFAGDAALQLQNRAESGSGRKCGRSSAKASLTTRKVVACVRGLATLSNQYRS